MTPEEWKAVICLFGVGFLAAALWVTDLVFVVMLMGKLRVKNSDLEVEGVGSIICGLAAIILSMVWMSECAGPGLSILFGSGLEEVPAVVEGTTK